MKFSHNKKRNTAFIFEVLIKELTKAALKENASRKQKIINVIKVYFSKEKILKKDLEIYKSLTEVDDLNKEAVEKILVESKKQFLALNRNEIFQEQSKIIRDINNNFGSRIWDNFIPSYKKLATVNQLLQQTSAPKKQVMLERKLIDTFCLDSTARNSERFPKVNNLAMKNFIEKFNEQYSEVLNESQKVFLSKYITSSSDESLEFKAYLYEEIEKIKCFLGENIHKYGSDTSHKINDVLEKISLYNRRKIDNNLIFEIFKVQTLVSELQKNGN